MTETAEGIIDLGGDGPVEIPHRVDDLMARIKKVATTDEGKLAVTLESEGLDDAALGEVKEMLSLQQAAVR